MKKIVIMAAIAALLASCQDDFPVYKIDAAKREEAFQSCLKALPAGPISTKYNDWDEVVDSCDSHALKVATYCAANCEKSWAPERRP